jgi:hypothetical protein
MHFLDKLDPALDRNNYCEWCGSVIPNDETICDECKQDIDDGVRPGTSAGMYDHRPFTLVNEDINKNQ